MKLIAYLASLAALASFALFAASLSFGGTGQPQPYTPGQRATLVAEPWPTVWPSLLSDAEVRLPSGAEYPPPHTITPTPTATPVPTPTPLPTAVPVYAPPPADEAPETPQSVSGDWQSVVCSYAWSCSEALNVIAHESGGDPYAVNPSSGACGLWQHYPCAAYGDVWASTALAWEKYAACGHSFQCGWYAWW